MYYFMSCIILICRWCVTGTDVKSEFDGDISGHWSTRFGDDDKKKGTEYK